MVVIPNINPRQARLLTGLFLIGLLVAAQPAQADEQEDDQEASVNDPPENIVAMIEQQFCQFTQNFCPQVYLGDWVFPPVRLYTICDPVSGYLVEIVQGYRYVFVGYYDSDGDWNDYMYTNTLIVGTRGTGTSCT